jgi:hypothetical protein
VSANAPATSGAPGRGTIFVFVDSINLRFIDNSISLLPLAMPEGGDSAACPASLPDEGRWVPRSVALAWQRAQEAVRHASALPSVGIIEAPTPKVDAASPQRKGGEDSTAAEPLKGKGGGAGCEDARGARAPPLIQLRAPCAVGTDVGSIREKGGASGRTVATHRPGLAP